MLSLVTQTTHFIYCTVFMNPSSTHSTDNLVHLVFLPATLTKSTLDFQLAFRILKIFVSFCHCFFFVFRSTLAFYSFGLVSFLVFLVFFSWSFLTFLLNGELVIISDLSHRLFVILNSFETFNISSKETFFF